MVLGLVHSVVPYAVSGTYPYTTKSLIQFRGTNYMSIDPKKIFITPLLYIVTYLWGHVWTLPVWLGAYFGLKMLLLDMPQLWTGLLFCLASFFVAERTSWYRCKSLISVFFSHILSHTLQNNQFLAQKNMQCCRKSLKTQKCILGRFSNPLQIDIWSISVKKF